MTNSNDMNPFDNMKRRPQALVRSLRLHLHSPTLDAVIQGLLRAGDIGSTDEAVRLVDAMRPPMAIVTMGDLFGHVDSHMDDHDDDDDEQEFGNDGCEICGVRCSSTAFAPYPGVCVRCTAKLQHLQRQKMKGGADAR